MKDGKNDQAVRCIKSRIMTKEVYKFISIDTFEQQFVVLKGMLQSPQLKYHVHTVGIDPSLIKSTMYEQKCLENIKKLYKKSGKCENQQQFKDIIKASVFYY